MNDQLLKVRQDAERLNISPTKAKLAAVTASLENLQANHHANGGFTHDR
jgi:hypothetical protein